MNIAETTREFLEHNGLSLKSSSYANDSLGDYCDTYSNGTILLRFVRDRSQLTIEICRNGILKKHWYDLGLLQNLMLGNRDLTQIPFYENQEVFLRHNLNKIIRLFAFSTYCKTKKP